MIAWERIEEARRRIAGTLSVTPVLTSRALDAEAAARLYLKAENFQKTGSFKARGALNRVLLLKDLPAGERPRGVVTASSGNHGQAVAFAAREVGVSAHIVVPEDASPAKVQAARGYGATVESCGTTSSARLRRAEEIQRTEGLLYVPPYDDPDVMAGQATVGVEILDQVPDVEVVLVPIGGGGLISGIASAIKQRNPSVRVIGVEPEGAAGTYMSRLAGKRVALPAGLTIADGLKTLEPGRLAFPIIEEAVDELVTVSDAQIRHALWQIITRVKVLVEPSGACALAYAVSQARPLAGRVVVAVLSGGNVAPETLCRLLPDHA